MLSIDGCCHTVNTSPHSSSLLESHSPEVCSSDFGDFNENFSRFCTNPVFILQSLQRLLSQRGDTMAFFQAVTKHLDMKTLTGFSRNLGFSEVPGSNAGPLSFIPRRWATKKAGGSTQNGRDSKPKFLGVKKFGGEKVIPGNIIVRQRGTRFHPGSYVGMGKDHTLYALKQGHVKFERSKMTGRKWVHVVPLEGHVLHPVYQQS